MIETKTTREQLDEIFKEWQFDYVERYDDSFMDLDNTKWIKVDDIIKMRDKAIKEAEQNNGGYDEWCEAEAYQIINTKINELSKSNPDDSVSQKRHVDSGNDTLKCEHKNVRYFTPQEWIKDTTYNSICLDCGYKFNRT